MADQRKEYHPMRPNVQGGEQNSEHELDVAGMRGSTASGDMQVEKERAEEGSLENLRKHRVERGESPEEPVVVRPRTSSVTSMEERIEEKERPGELLARTPQEMSYHDELSREPVKKQVEKKAEKTKAGEERGRDGA